MEDKDPLTYQSSDGVLYVHTYLKKINNFCWLLAVCVIRQNVFYLVSADE